jgi:hypothetical protein
MSRQLHGVEKGFRIYLENSDSFVDYLVGIAVPNGLLDQAEAPIGSMYQRIGTGELYQKNANAGAAADWVLNGAGSSSVIPVFRNIVVRAATIDALVAGSVDVSGFSDNESGLDGTAFTVGEHIISGVGGTPQLYEVTAVTSATDITIALATPALADNDGYIVRSYLPDSPSGQENQALVAFQAGNIVKLADVDWSFATGISLSSGYSATNGTVSSSDSVEVAIEKLDGNQQDLTTLSGVAQGSTDLGTFSGATIPDSQTTKQALQALEVAHEEVDANVDDLISLSGVAENVSNHGIMDQGEILSDNQTTNALLKEVDAELTKQRGKAGASGVTTLTTVDSVLVDEVANVEWIITLENAATPSNKRHVILYAGHNGHTAADATSSDDTEFAKLKQGANFNYTISSALVGTGAAQRMVLQVASTEPSGVNVYVKKIETLF